MVILATLGLGLLVYSIVSTNGNWNQLRTNAMFWVGLVLFVVFTILVLVFVSLRKD